MKSQWECFLENLGEWQGSFTQLSTEGKVQSDISSVLVLESLNEDRSTVRLTLRRTDQPDLILEFTHVGGSLQFFETGSFSQGALQFSPVGAFGAELALKWGDRRLRIVQQFKDRKFDRLTLIRERLAGADTPERPPLQVEDLLGEWQGEAVTLYPDLREPDTLPTQLQITREGDRLSQQLSWGSEPVRQTITSSAQIKDSMLLFNQGAVPMCVLLLPDGSSSNCPLEVRSGHSFLLEAGWLMQPDQRQRIIRSYNVKGEWVSLTLVTERKVR